jgi:hypothetical protein
MKLNLLLLLISCSSAIKVHTAGKSYIHLRLIEDPPAEPATPVVEDGAKAPGKDLSESVESSFKYPTSERSIPEPVKGGTRDLKIWNGKPEEIPLAASWPSANGEPTEGGASAAAPVAGATPAAPAAPVTPAAAPTK